MSTIENFKNIIQKNPHLLSFDINDRDDMWHITSELWDDKSNYPVTTNVGISKDFVDSSTTLAIVELFFFMISEAIRDNPPKRSISYISFPQWVDD